MLKERRIELGKYITPASSIKKDSAKKALIHDIKWGLKVNIAPIIISWLKCQGLGLDSRKFGLADNTFSAISYFVDTSCRYTGTQSFNFYERLLKTSAKLGIYHPNHSEIFRYITFSRDNYKLLLYGEPGTGKTSLSNILESVGETVVFVKSVRDTLILSPEPNRVYVIDDVDLLVPQHRDGDSKEKENLRKILAFLDKAEKVILTTNNPQDLDPALTRAGRVDRTFEIGYLAEEDIRKIITLRFMNICVRARTPNDSLVYNEFVNEFVDWVMSKLEPEERGLYSPCKVAKPVKRCAEVCRRLYIESILGKDEHTADIIELVDRDLNYKPSKLNRALSKIDDTLDYVHDFVRPYLYELVKQENTNETKDDDDSDDENF